MMFSFSDLTVGGISLVLVVIGLVEFSKKFGLSGNWLILLSAILGLVLGVGYKLTSGFPVDFTGWFTVIIFGLACGLSATGLYDYSKNLTNPTATPAETNTAVSSSTPPLDTSTSKRNDYHSFG